MKRLGGAYPITILVSSYIKWVTPLRLRCTTPHEWSDTANHQWSYANLLILCICVFCKPIILLFAIIAVYFLRHTLLVPSLWYCRARSTVLLVPNKPFCSCSLVYYNIALLIGQQAELTMKSPLLSTTYA